jgi:hypothetical protein
VPDTEDTGDDIGGPYISLILARESHIILIEVLAPSHHLYGLLLLFPCDTKEVLSFPVILAS